jgi:hypothetical protein
MDITALAIICTSSASAIGLTARQWIRHLDRDKERQLLRELVRAGMAEHFSYYIELRRAGNPRAPGHKPSNSSTPPPIIE